MLPGRGLGIPPPVESGAEGGAAGSVHGRGCRAGSWLTVGRAGCMALPSLGHRRATALGAFPGHQTLFLSEEG